MDKTKYSELINKAITNKDDQEILFKDLLDLVSADEIEYNNLKTQVSEQAEKIRNLQDTNMKLFLSQTSEIQDETEDEELEGDAAVLDFMKKLGGKSNGEYNYQSASRCFKR